MFMLWLQCAHIDDEEKKSILFCSDFKIKKSLSNANGNPVSTDDISKCTTNISPDYYFYTYKRAKIVTKWQPCGHTDDEEQKSICSVQISRLK